MSVHKLQLAGVDELTLTGKCLAIHYRLRHLIVHLGQPSLAVGGDGWMMVFRATEELRSQGPKVDTWADVPEARLGK